jgi:hypothetical protein
MKPVLQSPQNGGGCPFQLPVKKCYGNNRTLTGFDKKESGQFTTPEGCDYTIIALNFHERLVAMVKEMEWSGNYEGEKVCPECYQSHSKKNHAVGCALAALLLDLKNAEEQTK